jgi:hypothetical protein
LETKTRDIFLRDNKHTIKKLLIAVAGELFKPPKCPLLTSTVSLDSTEHTVYFLSDSLSFSLSLSLSFSLPGLYDYPSCFAFSLQTSSPLPPKEGERVLSTTTYFDDF